MENEQLILRKLDLISAQINFIKENISDATLTTDDLFSINQAEEDFKKGRTKRL